MKKEKVTLEELKKLLKEVKSENSLIYPNNSEQLKECVSRIVQKNLHLLEIED